MRDGSPRESVDLDAALKLGIYNAESLKKLGETSRREFLIDGLIARRTANLVVGNSGLGKTPLMVSLGLSVAAGLPFLGRPAEQGRVLVCDGESSHPEFYEIMTNISGHMGLAGIPPDFFAWSPMWAPVQDYEDAFGPAHLERIVATIQPDLAIIDPVRLFFPKAEGKSEDTIGMFRTLRNMTRRHGCAWVLVHHRRKIDQNYQISLETDALQWFQQSCGSLALVNHSDTRLGIDLPKENVGKEADLVVAGFVRSHGRVGPLYLGRVFDEEGVPIAYHQLGGLDFLPGQFRGAYSKLPNEFRFSDVHKALGGKSGSNAAAFLMQTRSLGLVRKLDQRRGYQKITENLEEADSAKIPGDSV